MEIVSSKEEMYLDPNISEYLLDKSKSEAMNITSRAMDGFLIACHVFAYLSGKEEKHSDNWLVERKKCANMLARSLVERDIYPEFHDDLEPKDYSISSGVKSRPILTNNIFREAARRFPVEGYLIGGLPFDNEVGAVKPREPFIKRKEVLAEFLCHINEKNLFLRDTQFWSNPVAGFCYDQSLPDEFMEDLWKKNIVSRSENVIGVLADWKNVAEGIVFTDKAMYMISSQNTVQKKYTVRYDEIKYLQYKQAVLLIKVAGGNVYEVDTPIWSKRNIYDFL